MAWDLKEAGFPQPEPFRRMAVYIYGDLRYVSYVKYNGDVEVSGMHVKDVVLTSEQFGQMCAFAPGAIDIMSAMPFAALAKFSDNSWVCVTSGRNCTDENPHEACAGLWLELHGYKTTTI